MYDFHRPTRRYWSHMLRAKMLKKRKSDTKIACDQTRPSPMFQGRNDPDRDAASWTVGVEMSRFVAIKRLYLLGNEGGAWRRQGPTLGWHAVVCGISRSAAGGPGR